MSNKREEAIAKSRTVAASATGAGQRTACSRVSLLMREPILNETSYPADFVRTRADGSAVMCDAAGRVAPQATDGGLARGRAAAARSVDLSEVERQQEDFGQKLPDKEDK